MALLQFKTWFEKYRNSECGIKEATYCSWAFTVAPHRYHANLAIFLKDSVHGERSSIGLTYFDGFDSGGLRSFNEEIFFPYEIVWHQDKPLIFSEESDHYNNLYPQSTFSWAYLRAKSELIGDAAEFLAFLKEDLEAKDAESRAAQQPLSGERYQVSLPPCSDKSLTLYYSSSLNCRGYGWEFKTNDGRGGLVPLPAGMVPFERHFLLDPRISLSKDKAIEMGEVAANLFSLLSEIGGVNSVELNPLSTTVSFEQKAAPTPESLASLIAQCIGVKECQLIEAESLYPIRLKNVH